ncbi:GntR family transcriptional regulator [Enterococcus sp. CSURQ0835]|uniref:GntR family transcriptional regulator n=1 Tax=Enterococcus sp. CSURQ0835 TaxID=2681394 RepID=UPI00190F2735|nr:GntR family transcriptional regulator [Enterococcus sp. CSURQ0835]
MLKYNEIALNIEKKIVQQDLKQGTKLPNFNEMIQEYGVSKSTIVKALTILEQRGVIYQVQGSGVFVRRKRKYGYINVIENQGFTTDLDDFTITSQVLTVEKILPPKNVQENLALKTEEQVFHVKRIRFINEQILCLEESYFCESVVPYLNEEIAGGSIFHYLRDALKLNIGFSDKYLKVKKLNAEHAQTLKLQLDDPAMYSEELFYLTSGKPFDYSKTVYHYQHSQFFLQSSNLNN